MNTDIIDILAGDPFYYNIIDNLDGNDIYNLLQTCHYYKESLNLSIIKKQTIKEINKRYHNIFGEHVMEFKRIVKDLECIVTGSFILQCILGLFWEGTDIDIYIKGSKGDYASNTLLDAFFVEVGYKICKTDCTYSDCLSGIIEVRTYDKINSLYKMQIIMIMEEGTLHNYVINNFDFDICKNIYSIGKDDKEKLVIVKINDILSKKTAFSIKDQKRIDKNIERCTKYQERGFDFINRNTMTYNDFPYANIFELTKINDTDDSYQMVNCDLDKLKAIITDTMCHLDRGKAYGDYIKICDNVIMINKNMFTSCQFNGVCIITKVCCKKHLHCHLDSGNTNIIVINNKYMDKF